MANSRRLNRGFSLIEMVIAIIIFLIVVVLASTVFVENFRIINAGQSFINADWQIRTSLLRMRSDVRAAVRINTAQTHTLTFDNNVGRTITYSLTDNKLLRDTRLLGKNVQTANSSFTYYDGAGNVTATLADIRYVIIILNIADDYNDFTVKSTVYLWNR